jgi:hypothetical protein
VCMGVRDEKGGWIDAMLPTSVSKGGHLSSGAAALLLVVTVSVPPSPT